MSVRVYAPGRIGFVDVVGFGDRPRAVVLGSRIIPVEGFLMTGAAALPVDAPLAERDLGVERTGCYPETFDYEQISPRLGAEVAIIIRECGRRG